MLTLLISLACLSLLVLLLIAFSSRHKKSASGEIVLLGRRGRVEQQLAPEGAVLVAGEMWRAVTHDGAAVEQGATVRVRGARGHLLVVEPE